MLKLHNLSRVYQTDEVETLALQFVFFDLQSLFIPQKQKGAHGPFL